MRQIGTVLRENYSDFGSMIEAARVRLEREEAEKRERYGEDFDVDKCWHCGGRGELPGDRGYCDKCDAGLTLLGANEYQKRWALTIPSRFRGYRFNTHPNKDATKGVLAWYRDGMARGQNLFLGGPVGTGKTGIAIAALWAAHQSGRSIHYTTVPDMLDGLRPKNPDLDSNEESITRLQTVGLLLLDDMGAENSNSWPREQLYLVVNGRYHHGLPTIITSNYQPETLGHEDRAGDRVISRLMENARTMWLDGDDLRLKKVGN